MRVAARFTASSGRSYAGAVLIGCPTVHVHDAAALPRADVVRLWRVIQVLAEPGEGRATYPGRVVTPEQLETLGLLAPPEPATATPLKFTSQRRGRPDQERQWPSYEMSLAGAPLGESGPDRSRADFWWSYLALQRGWSQEETERNSWR